MAWLQRSRRSSRRTRLSYLALQHVDTVASTEPSFFTTDKRRARRATSSALPCFNGAVVLHDGQGYMPGGMRRFSPCFNGAVVLHDGQVAVCANHHDGGHLRASTEPSFFTTDKTPSSGLRRPRSATLQRSRRSSRRTSLARLAGGPAPLHVASTEPSFFTTDKSNMGYTRPSPASASTEPSFFTTDKSRLLPSSARSISQELQRSRRSSRRTRRAGSRSCSRSLVSFNGAVVLHDGQVAVLLAASDGAASMLQRSRRSSRRTSADR